MVEPPQVIPNILLPSLDFRFPRSYFPIKPHEIPYFPNYHPHNLHFQQLQRSRHNSIQSSNTVLPSKNLQIHARYSIPIKLLQFQQQYAQDVLSSPEER
jgi:hypothetical protein